MSGHESPQLVPPPDMADGAGVQPIPKMPAGISDFRYSQPPPEIGTDSVGVTAPPSKSGRFSRFRDVISKRNGRAEVDPSGIAEYPIPENASSIGFSGTLSPINVIRGYDRDGKPFDNTVLAMVKDANGNAVYLVENPFGVGLIKLGDGVSRTKGSRLYPDGHSKSEKASLPLGPDKIGDRGWVRVDKSLDPNDNYTWCFSTGGTTPKTITVGQGVQKVKRPASAVETGWKREKRQRIIAKVAKTALAFSVVYPGGIVDKAADPFVGTANTVQMAGEDMLQQIYGPDDMFDGIKIKDYPPGAMDDFNKEPNTINAGIMKATESVKLIMADLDAHRYDDIRRRADTYVQSHPGCLMTKEQRQTLLLNINNANSPAELQQALIPFEQFSGKSVTVKASPDDFSDAKNNTASYVDFMSGLPQAIFQHSAAEKIVFGNPKDIVQADGIAGVYEPNESRITVGAKTDPFVSVMKTLFKLYPLNGSGDLSNEQTLAHEISHSINLPETKNGIVIKSDFIVQLMPIADAFIGGILDSPRAPSSYSYTSPIELSAEAVGAVLSYSGSGLAHPDQVRHFKSPGNQNEISALIGLDTLDPGLADLLVSLNPRLIDRTFVISR